MTTREWVDSAIRLLEVLVSWPVFAAVMLIVFREQVFEAGRWLGRLIEKREVTASTPVGTITLKRLGKAEVARAVKATVEKAKGATRSEPDAAGQIVAATRELEQRLRDGADPELAGAAEADAFQLTFAGPVPPITIPAGNDLARALVLLRFAARDDLPRDPDEWAEAASATANGAGPSLTRLQFQLIGEADELEAIRTR